MLRSVNSLRNNLGRRHNTTSPEVVFLTPGYSVGSYAYIRQKKGNRLLTPQEYIDLSYARGFTRSDRELVRDVSLKLLDTPTFRSWANARSIGGDVADILLATGLAREEDGSILPTRAAVMLFAQYPTMLMETKCAVKIMKYDDSVERYGSTPNMVGVPKIIDAPIIEQIRRAQEYVLTLLSGGVEIHSGFITKYIIPERAVREAITNAIIHRDYNLKRDIEIKIFPDRVEVTNPGLLPYNINVRNIGRERAPGYRNELIIKTLREFPSPPNLDQNEGVIAMRNEMRACGLYPPIFVTYPHLPDVVNVVLLNEHTPSEWEKVKQYLQDHHYITNGEARSITGVVQVYQMSRMLNKWCRQGLLLRVDTSGGQKNAKYKLAGSNQESQL